MEHKIIFFVCLFLFSPAVYAQQNLAKGLLGSVIKAEASVSKKMLGTASLYRGELVQTYGEPTPLSAALKRGVWASQQNGLAALGARTLNSTFLTPKNTLLLQHISQAVFRASGQQDQLFASGFFFEENYQGKRIVWGVVSAHLAGGKGQKVSLLFRNKQGALAWLVLPTTLIGSAGYSNLDIALIKIPEHMASSMRTLPLASHPAEQGSEVASFGFNGELTNFPRLHPVWNRKILQHDGLFIKTSFNFANELSGGACGSPLLNARGEVIGIHTGSHSRAVSFAVEAPRAIATLLREYRYPGTETRCVQINGKEVFRLSPSQRISTVVIRRWNEKPRKVNLTQYPKKIDFMHLETILDLRAGDGVELYISEQGVRELKRIRLSLPWAGGLFK